MSSNAADPTHPVAAAAWSLTARLALLYTLATTGILLAVSGLLYFALVSQLDGEDETSLANELQTVLGLLREPSGEESLLVRGEMGIGAGVRHRSEYSMRLVDASGNTLLESPQMPKALSPGIFPWPLTVATDARPAAVKRWQAPDGRVFLLTAGRVDPGSASRGRLIQAALDCSDEERLISAFRWKLVGFSLGGAVLSAGVGAWVARRGLRPLREITRAVARAGPTRLQERIGAQAWPGELTALAAAFDQMLQRLDDSFGRLSELSADVAHELRTPINNLRGEAELALAKARGAAEYRTVLASALEEYDRLARMIDGLLFLARAESTEIRLAPVAVEVRREAAAVLEYYEALAQEKEVKLTLAGEGRLQADPLLLRRTLSNLLANALRHTPAGGSIQVAIVAEPDGAARITVRDTGEGIAAEDLPRIFERFYRADRARSAGAEHGTGLGLSIVRSIMELHGGTVSAEGAPGAGAVFTLRFPARNA